MNEGKQRKYYRDRLADPSLLRFAVRLRVDGEFFDLAVPVGGLRRGGYVSCATIKWAKQVYRQLDGMPGFPRLRIDYSPHPEACHAVEWGEMPPEEGDEACGRFYGYREEAIAEYVSSR